MRSSDWSSDVCSSDLAALDDRRQQAERAEVDEHREEVAAEEDGEEAPLWWLLGHVGAAGEHRGRGDAALAQQGHEQDEGGEEGGAVEAAQRQRPGLRIIGQGEREKGGAEAEQVALAQAQRSEERRVGKAGVSTCRSRWWPD